MAEELDIPVGIHMGLGPPGAPYIGSPNYRARLSNPLLIEDVLVRHPKLRVYVMHAGWPMLDEMIHLLYTHPQVHVDVAVIDYLLPRLEFHNYLRRIAEAGFASRVMFGSDQMNWPQAIPYAIESIESAAFLTAQQKRDILYNNAARFLRLTDAEIARHHGR
jgi:predicted TIM-barrel fold metal-dependent hydrolase